MYTAMSQAGGSNIQASRSFRGLTGHPGGNLGMLTVYGYGFEEPKPAEPPTPWGMYAVLAAAGWWAWRKWGKKSAV